MLVGRIVDIGVGGSWWGWLGCDGGSMRGGLVVECRLSACGACGEKIVELFGEDWISSFAFFSVGIAKTE